MAKTPEAKVRDPVVKWAKENGIGHVRMSFRPGVKQAYPDDLFLIPGGRTAWIEFKRPGKEPTELQWSRINKLREHGHVAWWFSNSAEAIQYLKYSLVRAPINDVPLVTPTR